MLRIQKWVGSAALAAVALSAVAALSNGGVTTRADARESYVCMTDDGYGRLRPCSAGYMASNPAWRAGDTCFTDDGYGRYRPCSAGYKAKQQQK
jgi:hypothetical protein